MPGGVSIRIPCLELDQELQRGLIGIGIQTLKHLCPMRLERIGSPAAASICVPVSALADHYTARSGIVTPDSDPMDKGFELAAVEATGGLGAQFIEQLGWVDVRPCLKPPAHQRPDQCERVPPLNVKSRKPPALQLPLLFPFRIHPRRGG